MAFLTRLAQAKLDDVTTKELQELHRGYLEAARENQYDLKEAESVLDQLLELILEQLKNPFSFEKFHQAETKHYHFGVNFIRPLVKIGQSRVVNPHYLKEIESHLARGENVILLANHQTELDPQAISLLLEKTHPKLAFNLIAVAGHRVTSDPLAVPFSRGCNLLCVFSKKYIDDDPTTKESKIVHNQQTMRRMSELLSEGGKCIYVAPSGGRDRPDANGDVVVAPFDPQSIEMFSLMSQHSGRKTHFYPLALATYHLLPPPDNIKKQLGEPRPIQATPIHLALGPEIDMNHFPGSDGLDKHQRRKARAEYIWEQVKNEYDRL